MNNIKDRISSSDRIEIHAHVETDKSKTFGEVLKSLREQQNLTQIEVAEKLNMTRQAYGRYERYENPPKPSTIEKIAEALSIPAAALEINSPFIQTFDTALDFEKEWIRKGAAPHYGSEIGRSAALLVKFEELNEAGQRQAIDMLDLLLKVPEYRKKEKESE